MSDPIAEGFVVPDFTASLDVEALVAAVPPAAVLKGVVPQSAIEALVAAGKPPPSFQTRPFRDVSMREAMRLLVQCAETLHPGEPQRQALRRLGQQLFPAFKQTLVGRVMYGVFRGDVHSILRLANRSFEMTQNTGKVETRVLDAQSVRLAFTNTYTFLDCYHFGILEGTLTECGATGEVWFKPGPTPQSGEFQVSWQRGTK